MHFSLDLLVLFLASEGISVKERKHSSVVKLQGPLRGGYGYFPATTGTQ